jgi:amidohydrolase
MEQRAATPLPCVRSRAALIAALAALACPASGAEPAAGVDRLAADIDRAAAAAETRVIGWRRDIHQHPELSNREQRTASVVADHLEALGLEVRRGVAHTGVVGVLRGPAGGKVVALRADMDALPVTEATGLPFASVATATYLGREVGVMHACGHDAHTAILMGVAEALASVRERLPGSVVFVFQPAEEGPPPGEEGGASLMLAQGVFDDPTPLAVFGLHATHRQEAGTLGYREGALLASSDKLTIRVGGRQTHAANPWLGIDPIAVAARLIPALHAIPAREVDARIPAVVSIGAIHGGVRHNIIPAEVELLGTIRSLANEQRAVLHEKVRRTAEGIAASAGAQIEVEISQGNPITYNDPALTRRMLPTLERVAGAERVVEVLPDTVAEDFAWYQQRVPGLFFWLGVRDPAVAAADAAPNHSPGFRVDERALPLGVRALARLAIDFLAPDPR